MKLKLLLAALSLSSMLAHAQNVGVGTTTPAYPLTVKDNGNGNTVVATSNNGSVKVGLNAHNLGVAGIQTLSAHNLEIGTLAYPQAIVAQNSNGYVGIGTSTPANNLTVKGNGQTVSAESADGSRKIGFYVSNSGTPYLQTHTNHDLNFGTNNSLPQMTLQSGTGNFGIGTTTPTNAGLVVNKKIGATNALFGANTTGVAIESGWPGIGFNSYYNGGRKAIAAGYAGYIGVDQNNGNLTLGTSPTNFLAADDAVNDVSTKMVVTGAGNVGIGTTGPISRLMVQGDVGYAARIVGGTFGLRVYDAANAGITVNNCGDGSESIRIVGGRLKLTGNLANGNAHGIMLTNNAGTTDRGFLGMKDDNTMGLYGTGGAGWGLLWDVNDASLRIGTNQKANGYMLNVGGSIISEEVRVQLRSAWPDYVFTNQHHRLSITDLEKFVQEKKHLPNIPSAKEVEQNGQNLGDLQRRMMEKIEELSLYIIDLKKEIDTLKAEQKLKN